MSDNDDVPLVDQLMSALITKMEKMDTDIDALRHENQVLKGIISNPDLHHREHHNQQTYSQILLEETLLKS